MSLESLWIVRYDMGIIIFLGKIVLFLCLKDNIR